MALYPTPAPTAALTLLQTHHPSSRHETACRGRHGRDVAPANPSTPPTPPHACRRYVAATHGAGQTRRALPRGRTASAPIQSPCLVACVARRCCRRHRAPAYCAAHHRGPLPVQAHAQDGPRTLHEGGPSVRFLLLLCHTLCDTRHEAGLDGLDRPRGAALQVAMHTHARRRRQQRISGLGAGCVRKQGGGGGGMTRTGGRMAVARDVPGRPPHTHTQHALAPNPAVRQPATHRLFRG